MVLDTSCAIPEPTGRVGESQLHRPVRAPDRGAHVFLQHPRRNSELLSTELIRAAECGPFDPRGRPQARTPHPQHDRNVTKPVTEPKVAGV